MLAVAVLLLALAAGRRGSPTTRHRRPPGPLVVALGLQGAVLQAGVVRGRDVILARGFEVELARTLARRLGGHVERFVYVPSQTRLRASSGGGWQLALAGIEPSRAGRAGADLSVPYLTTDVAVIARRGLERPRRLADLRPALLCAVLSAKSPGLMCEIFDRGRRRASWRARLWTMVRTGACDAALVSAAEAGRFIDGQRGALGPSSAGSRGRASSSRSRGAGIVAAVDREPAASG
jgi:hypothetical protein